MSRIFIVAGDPSGDIHASRLMNEIRQLYPEASFYGIGGRRMQEAGLESLYPMDQISVVGFWEVIKRYSFFKNVLEKSKQVMTEMKCDIFIPVDFPGFNLRLAKYAKTRGVPVYYYIAPQLWAWGRNRAKNLNEIIQKLLVVFPFEKDYFQKFGIECEYVGHPLLDDSDFHLSNDSGNDKREKTIAFLPGSRQQEIVRHMPLYNRVYSLLKKKLPDYKLALSIAPELKKSDYNRFLQENNWTVSHDARELMQTSTAGIIKTGTSTLEAALCELPFAMIYKTSAMTYTLGKNLINLPYISLPNILLNQSVVHEFIQTGAEPGAIATEVEKLISNEEYRKDHISAFIRIRELLGGPGASSRAAGIIVNKLMKQ